MSMREHRALRDPDIATSPDQPRMFEAVVMQYGVLDDYSTIFDKGCFSDSLDERLPRITWAHDWSEPLGRYVDFRDTDESLTLIGEFDDFEAVPRARQAYAQLRSGTIDQFSVGFTRDQVAEDDDGVVHFVKARLDEAALVLAGAVPGTKLVQVRSGLMVPAESVILLARKVAAEDLTREEALAALDLMTMPETATVIPTVEPPVETPEDDAELADADEALIALGLDT